MSSPDGLAGLFFIFVIVLLNAMFVIGIYKPTKDIEFVNSHDYSDLQIAEMKNKSYSICYTCFSNVSCVEINNILDSSTDYDASCKLLFLNCEKGINCSTVWKDYKYMQSVADTNPSVKLYAILELVFTLICVGPSIVGCYSYLVYSLVSLCCKKGIIQNSEIEPETII